MSSICTHCGNDIPTQDEAHRRIRDLEAQVRLLNTKAAAAVDKLSDYEDEVRSLRSACTQLQQQLQSSPPPPPPLPPSKHALPSQAQPAAPSPPPKDQPADSPVLTGTTTQSQSPLPNPSSPPRNLSRLASLSSFLPGRKRDTTILQQPPNTPAVALFSQNQNPTHTQSTSALPDTILSSSIDTKPQPQGQGITLLTLQTSLETERTLRLRAESTLNETQSELEELTATLFGQANEMVATERKARAKLEERVKVLEDRDGEKKRRLERLEKALERIERVRGLVREEEGKGVIKIELVEVDGVEEDGEKERLRVVNDES